MRARLRSPLFFVALAALVAASLAARGAHAFVRSVIISPGPPQVENQLYWSSSCETVTVYMNGFTDMTPDEVAKSVAAAAAAWGPDQVTCPAASGSGGAGHPSFQIMAQMGTGSPPTPSASTGRYGQNIVVFQTETWGSDLPPNALAYAKVFKEPSGHIVEADIFINAVPAVMPGPLANLDPGAPLSAHGQLRFDLQTILTHEFGHFLGLGHTCQSDSYTGGDDSGDPTSGLDDQGQPIPTCMMYPSASEATQAAAVMWFEIDPGTKRVLTADDALGVCAIYPPTRAAPACTQNTPDDGCGCAAAGTTPGSAASAAALALALAASRRRRRPLR